MARTLPGMTIRRSMIPAARVMATILRMSGAREVRDLTAWRANKPPTKMMAAERWRKRRIWYGLKAT
jgi:hypothetical protein